MARRGDGVNWPRCERLTEEQRIRERDRAESASGCHKVLAMALDWMLRAEAGS
jgi:hypothetical protein